MHGMTNRRIWLRIVIGIFAAVIWLWPNTQTVRAQYEDTLELSGTLRDFRDDHSDFEDSYNRRFGLITGMVRSTLGQDGLPILNVPDPQLTRGDADDMNDAHVTVTFEPGGVHVLSNRNLVRITLLLDDESRIEHPAHGYEMRIDLSLDDDTKHVVGVWVDCDVPGDDDTVRGRWFAWDQAQCDVPRQWRIADHVSFAQWFRNDSQINQSTQYTITLRDRDGDGIYRYARSKSTGESFFPLDHRGFGNEGRSHNYHFTYAIRSKFTYTDPASRDQPLVFRFSGDDDVWVYINRQLVVDIGGVHAEVAREINVDQLAYALGLEPGETYDFHFFFAERHTTQSNFTIETTIQFLPPLYD